MFGAFASLPPEIVPRPSRRFPEEHSDPYTTHLGALYELSYVAICGSPAWVTVTGMLEVAVNDPSLAVTVTEPDPPAEDVGTMLRTSVCGVDDTDTLDGVTAQLIPVNEDESQPDEVMLTVPVYPSTP